MPLLTYSFSWVGLGWPWVGEFVGFITIFICFPTQPNLVKRKHPNIAVRGYAPIRLHGVITAVNLRTYTVTPQYRYSSRLQHRYQVYRYAAVTPLHRRTVSDANGQRKPSLWRMKQHRHTNRQMNPFLCRMEQYRHTTIQQLHGAIPLHGGFGVLALAHPSSRIAESAEATSSANKSPLFTFAAAAAAVPRSQGMPGAASRFSCGRSGRAHQQRNKTEA